MEDNTETIIKQFKKRSLLQESFTRLTRYLVGAAVTAITVASGYGGFASACLIVGCGVAYVGVNYWYDHLLWQQSSDDEPSSS